MNTTIKLSGILSWFIIIVACIFIFFGLLAALATGNIGLAFISFVLFGAIALHSHAALQLRKSAMYANEPLENKTSSAVQIMGFIAMFFGFVTVVQFGTALRHSKELAADLKKTMPPQVQQQQIDFNALILIMGSFMVIYGLCILVNVLINMSLLKWYKSQVENQEQDQEQE